eukprot:TRINITY_DN804_c0_g1_i1.p1 TRINITY_DN804_c0_g1~~TRINITY_DN804_c0_g1_i1.p1  ORF type:complete len:391 (+),score=65.72 TRINITY_DN804_c0_g1_i1:306-1478(+)
MQQAARRAALLARTPALPPLHSALGSSAPGSTNFDTSDVRFSSSLAVRTPTRHRGTGGRSSVSGVIATVFGATGFLGRYVVQQLARIGSQVVIPYRGVDDEYRHLKLMGDLGQIVPIRYDIRDEESIKAAISKSNVVINVVGREHETRNFSFEDINIKAAERLARVAKEHGEITKYVHVSCLGASPSAASNQHKTKAAGEKQVIKAFPEATILRPAPMVGTEDRLLNRYALYAKNFPAVPIISGGKTRLQPVHVVDVAAAVVASVKDEGTSLGKAYELGGPDVFTINELVHLMYETIREHPRIIDIPAFIAHLIATPGEFLRKRSIPIPRALVFDRDYLSALEDDYVVSPDVLGFADLGVVPRKLQGIAIEHLYAFRKGGPSVGATLDRV